MKKIYYQGIAGSYSFQAAKKIFPQEKSFIGTEKFKEIFNFVIADKDSFGVIPIENTIAGSVYENYDLLFQHASQIKIVKETNLKIEHCLLGIRTFLSFYERMKKIKKVYSHPKALEQCLVFFEKFPWIEKVAYSDTARASLFIAEKNDLSLASIASQQAAHLYQLDIIKKNIEDNQKNFTRFFLITNKKNSFSSFTLNKVSLIFNLPHQPGALYQALKILALKKINLTKIESRPLIGRSFEYNFFIDFEFSQKKKEIDLILKDFKKKVRNLKILGYYEKSD